MRKPPSNESAERALLGSILMRPAIFFDCAALVNESMFFLEKHRTIFAAILALHREDAPIDLLTLANKLDVALPAIGGRTYLVQLTQSVPSSTNWKNYANTIKREFLHRQLVDVGLEISEIGYKSEDDAISSAVSVINQKIFTPEVRTEETLDDVIRDFRAHQEMYLEKFRSGQEYIGIPTGYEKIDKAIDGIRPSHLWIVGAYTGVGKTFAALNIVASLINQGKRVVFYSLEMTKIEIIERLLGIMTEQNGATILKNFPHDREKVDEALKKIAASQFVVYENEFRDISEIRFSMMGENIKKPVDVFFVDYLQLVDVKGARSEYERGTQASYEFQAAAKRVKVPIILLSQINNDSARSEESAVMGFKGTGAIATIANFAIELRLSEDDKEAYRAKQERGDPICINWVIKKNRHGRTGKVGMLFDGKTGRFYYPDTEFDKIGEKEKKKQKDIPF